MLALLLENGAERANRIIKDYEPPFASKEEYFEYLKRFVCSGERITYSEDGARIEL